MLLHHSARLPRKLPQLMILGGQWPLGMYKGFSHTKHAPLGIALWTRASTHVGHTYICTSAPCIARRHEYASNASGPWFGLTMLVESCRSGSHTDDTIANLCRGDIMAIAASFNSVGPRACSFRRRRPISIKRPSVCFILFSPYSRILYSFVTPHFSLSLIISQKSAPQLLIVLHTT
jgi:hypothetical protein